MGSKRLFLLAALLFLVTFCNGLEDGTYTEPDEPGNNTTTETEDTTVEEAETTPDGTPETTTTEEEDTETETEDPTTPGYGEAPTITIDNFGEIVGIVMHNRLDNPLFAYLKIPFAEPPVAELRFKNPVPVTTLNDRTDPNVDMPACAQYSEGNVIGEEDCLYLNIYIPPFDPETAEPSSGAPVMVFFHGGTFDDGSASGDYYDPRFLLTENIVLVTVNYRLGILGFFNMDDPNVETPGNAALQDQHVALQWIKNNIGSFGGNPNNICLFGQGAGAASIHLQMLSPKSQDLFHKAILQSGTAISPWVRGIANNGLNLAEELGIATEDQQEMINELRAASVEEILTAAATIVEGLRYASNPWTPFAGPIIESSESESSFLTGNPFDLLETGSYHDVPLLIGFNNAEGIGVTQKLRATNDWNNTIEDFFDILPSELELERGSSAVEDIAMRIQEHYFADENQNGVITLFTDIFFAFPAFRAALEHSRTGNESIYFYKFEADTYLNVFKLDDDISATKEGASHRDELGYLFYIPGLTDTIGQQEENAMERVVEIWTTFARIGQPIENNPEIPEAATFENQWVPFTKEQANYARVATDDTVPETDLYTENLQLWSTIYDDFFRGTASSFQTTSLLVAISVALTHILFNYS